MKQLTQQEMNKVLLERVPLEDRLRFTYIPLYLTEVATIMVVDVLDKLAELRFTETKKICQSLRMLIRNVDKDRYQQMGKSLYDICHTKASEIKRALDYSLTVYRNSYWTYLRNLSSPNFSPDETDILSRTFVATRILGYITEYDRWAISQIKEYVSNDFTYTASPDPYPISLRNHLIQLICAFKANPVWETDNTELSYQVFKNKVTSIDIHL